MFGVADPILLGHFKGLMSKNGQARLGQQHQTAVPLVQVSL